MYIAYDTETELIADRKTLRLGTRKIKLEPFIPPRLVCVSECGPCGVRLYGYDSGVSAVEAALESSETHLVFHNAAFDIAVLVAAGVADWKVKKAVRERRIHDTMFMDILVGLAMGRYDMPNPPKFECPRVEPRSLDTLAQVYLNRTLDKDPAIRLAYGQFLGQPISALPPAFQTYAKEDARATYDVWMRMTAGLDDKLLSEPIQTAASIALADLDQTGTRIDKAEAQRLLPMFEKDMPELEEELVRAGLGREGVVNQTHRKLDPSEVDEEIMELMPSIWHPMEILHRGDDRLIRVTRYKTKDHVQISWGRRSFHLNFNEIRSRLEELEKQLKVKAPRSETGLLSMDADWWAERLPADAHDLHTWQKRQKLEKILNTYLRLYSQVDRVFANWNVLGARSGRMSCSSPAIQTIPKRRYGIRSLFVPDEGKVFVVADYCYQELVTLADTMAHMGIRGPLLESLAAGLDPHVATVLRTIGPQKEKICQLIAAQLVACWTGDGLQLPDAGSLRAIATTKAMVRLESLVKSNSVTELHLEFGSERFLKECASVITAIIQHALTQNTCSLEPSLITTMTEITKGDTLRWWDLRTVIGKEDLQRLLDVIIESTCADIVSPLAVTKKQRQAGKAVGFGIPGGLGAARLKEYAKQNYGVELTLDEAKAMRRAHLRAFPDVAEFLSRMSTDFNAGLIRHSGRGVHEWKQILGLDEHAWVRDVKLAMLSHESQGVRMVCHKAERGITVKLPSGRWRKGPTYTEAANSMFQGPASDVSKLAVVKAWLAGLEVKLVVHDELVTQCDPKDFKTTAELTESTMLAAFRDLCPVAGQYAKVEVEGPLERWGKATDKEGNAV